MKEIVWWLKDSKKVRDSNIVKAVVGSIKCDAMSHESLRNISNNKYEFAESLTAKGVPDSICDLRCLKSTWQPRSGVVQWIIDQRREVCFLIHDFELHFELLSLIESESIFCGEYSFSCPAYRRSGGTVYHPRKQSAY